MWHQSHLLFYCNDIDNKYFKHFCFSYEIPVLIIELNWHFFIAISLFRFPILLQFPIHIFIAISLFWFPSLLLLVTFSQNGSLLIPCTFFYLLKTMFVPYIHQTHYFLYFNLNLSLYVFVCLCFPQEVN